MQRCTYRIIDANFNRAREAARVIEDFARFALNSKTLTERAKKIRHRLSAMIASLDTAKLLCSRDTLGDIGLGSTVEGAITRANLKDCLVAACKRLTEALRVLSETVQTLDAALAQRIENLRYDAYTLEKDILICSDTAEKFSRVRLYVIISSSLPAEVISLTYCCIKGGADCIQLRAKAIEDNKFFAIAREFVKICNSAPVLSIINDRADIAAAVGADGVHLGSHDLPVEQARKLQLTPLIIGSTTHSLAELQNSCRQMPTYVALGPVFATPTKPKVKPVGPGYLTEAKGILADTGIAAVAVGGITLENVEQVLAAGVNAIAVCSAVTAGGDPAANCRALKNRIADFAKPQATA